MEHPINALTDLYTIREKKGFIRGLKISIVGNIGLGSINSLVLASVKLGAKVSLVAPSSIALSPVYMIKAREYGIVDTFTELQEGIQDADIIYTDYFVPESEKDKANALASYSLDYKAIPENKLVMTSFPALASNIGSDVLESSKSTFIDQSKNRVLIAQAILLFLSAKSL